MKKVLGYIPLYLLTAVILIGTYQSPYQDVTHILFYVGLSGLLTAFSSPITVKLFLFLILAPWHEVIVPRKTQLTSNPLVSVIIPAWNEKVGVISTIKTILASSYRTIEIIIVNDGSTDQSDTLIRDFLARYEHAMRSVIGSIPIYYYYQQNAGKGTALNTGIHLSHGDIMLCIDADCILSKDCILNFVLAMQDQRIMAVCGNVRVGNPSTLLSSIQMIEYAQSFYSRQTDALLGTLYVISGAAGAYRREVFDRVGYYDTSLRGGGEDVDLSIRVQQAGMKIGYATQSIIYTEVPTTLKGLTKQRLRWTRSRFEMFRRYPRFVFSLDKKHNKLLTCMVLPLIVFNDWLYVFKMALKLSLYAYCVMMHSYQLLAMLIVVTTLISGIPLWASKDYRKYTVLAPVYWLLSFIPSFIEVYAICSAVWGMWSKREVQWQQWKREGAFAVTRRDRR